SQRSALPHVPTERAGLKPKPKWCNLVRSMPLRQPFSDQTSGCVRLHGGISNFQHPILNVAWSPNDSNLVVAGADGILRRPRPPVEVPITRRIDEIPID